MASVRYNVRASRICGLSLPLTTHHSPLAMPFSTLLLEQRDGIALVTINRPDKLNALNHAVIQELGELASRIHSDGEIRAVMLTGAGPKAFVAGADIGELASCGPAEAERLSQEGSRVFRMLEQSRKPVLAAVNGFALGGGCELAMACHLRIAAESARFGQPEVKLGITPGYGGTVRLPRLIGAGRALAVVLTGPMLGARQAWRIRLGNRGVPDRPAELRRPGRQQLHRLVHVPPGRGHTDPEPGRELGERLALAQVGQDQQSLPPGVQLPPQRPDRGPVAADDPGRVVEGLAGQPQRGTVGQHGSPWEWLMKHSWSIASSTGASSLSAEARRDVIRPCPFRA